VDNSETKEVAPRLHLRPLFAVAVVLVCFLISQVLAILFSGVVGIGYALLPAFILGEIIPVFVLARLFTPSVRASLRLFSVGLLPLLFSVVATLSFVLLQYNVAAIVEKLLPMPIQFQEFLLEITRVRSLSEFLRVASGVVLGAAVAEELLFRGLLQGSLEARHGRWRAIVLSSLLFAVLHDPWRFVPVFFIGVLLGYLVSRGGSVYYGMVAHAVTNSASVAGGNILGVDGRVEISLPTAIIPIAGLVFLLSLIGFIRTARPREPFSAPASGEFHQLTGE
jgi:membrane protease YdiL (CAAX protease family)